MQTSTMSYNAGPVDEVFCFHLSLEKVYVTGSNSSLILFQTSLLYHEDTTNMMMQSALKVVLFVSIIALSFVNLCSTDLMDPEDLSLTMEVQEGKDTVTEIQESIPEIECSQSLKGLQHLKKQKKCCTGPKKNKSKKNDCIGKKRVEMCIHGLDVALRYVPFFVEEMEAYPNDTIVQEIKSSLQIFNRTFKERLGQCITPNQDRGKKYKVKSNDAENCGPKSLVLEGVHEWASNVISIYTKLNETKEDEKRGFNKRCQRNMRKRRKEHKKQRRMQKEQKRENRRLRRLGNLPQKEIQPSLAEQDEGMITSPPPDCI